MITKLAHRTPSEPQGVSLRVLGHAENLDPSARLRVAARTKRGRAGSVLLEVVIAASLFFIAGIFVMDGLNSAIRGVGTIKLEAEAMDLAVTTFSEVQMGLTPLQSVGPVGVAFSGAEGWTYELIVTGLEDAQDMPQLKKLEIIVRNEANTFTHRTTHLIWDNPNPQPAVPGVDQIPSDLAGQIPGGTAGLPSDLPGGGAGTGTLGGGAGTGGTRPGAGRGNGGDATPAFPPRGNGGNTPDVTPRFPPRPDGGNAGDLPAIPPRGNGGNKGAPPDATPRFPQGGGPNNGSKGKTPDVTPRFPPRGDGGNKAPMPPQRPPGGNDADKKDKGETP